METGMSRNPSKQTGPVWQRPAVKVDVTSPGYRLIVAEVLKVLDAEIAAAKAKRDQART
jgi:hypothetical protein